MSSGYNSKVFTFPGLKLQKILLYKDIEKIRKDCELLGLKFIDQNILFQKTNFKGEVQLVRRNEYFIISDSTSDTKIVFCILDEFRNVLHPSVSTEFSTTYSSLIRVTFLQECKNGTKSTVYYNKFNISKLLVIRKKFIICIMSSKNI